MLAFVVPRWGPRMPPFSLTLAASAFAYGSVWLALLPGAHEWASRLGSDFDSLGIMPLGVVIHRLPALAIAAACLLVLLRTPRALTGFLASLCLLAGFSLGTWTWARHEARRARQGRLVVAPAIAPLDLRALPILLAQSPRPDPRLGHRLTLLAVQPAGLWVYDLDAGTALRLPPDWTVTLNRTR